MPALPGGQTTKLAGAGGGGGGGGGGRNMAGGNDGGGGGGGGFMAAAGQAQQNASMVSGLIESVAGIMDEGKKLAKDVIGKPFDTAAGYARKGQSAVNNDMAGMIEQFDALPDGVKKFTRALTDLTNSIDQQGRRLGKYDGRLALAGAQADVRGMQAEIGEAKYVSESYARVTDQKSKLDAEIVAALNPIKDSIAKLVADLLPLVRDMLAFYRNNLEPAVIVIMEVGRAQIKLWTDGFGAAKEVIQGIPDAIAKAQRQAAMPEQFVRELFKNSLDENAKRRNRTQEEFPAPNGFVGLADI